MYFQGPAGSPAMVEGEHESIPQAILDQLQLFYKSRKRNFEILQRVKPLSFTQI